MVSITEVMSKELKKIPCEASIADTAQKMRDEQVPLHRKKWRMAV